MLLSELNALKDLFYSSLGNYITLYVSIPYIHVTIDSSVCDYIDNIVYTYKITIKHLDYEHS